MVYFVINIIICWVFLVIVRENSVNVGLNVIKVYLKKIIRVMLMRIMWIEMKID